MGTPVHHAARGDKQLWKGTPPSAGHPSLRWFMNLFFIFPPSSSSFPPNPRASLSELEERLATQPSCKFAQPRAGRRARTAGSRERALTHTARHQMERVDKGQQGLVTHTRRPPPPEGRGASAYDPWLAGGTVLSAYGPPRPRMARLCWLQRPLSASRGHHDSFRGSAGVGSKQGWWL